MNLKGMLSKSSWSQNFTYCINKFNKNKDRNKNILSGIYYVLGTRSDTFTHVYIHTLSASSVFCFLTERMICANVGLETKYVFMQKVKNDRLPVFCGSLRVKGNMTQNSSAIILFLACLRSGGVEGLPN